MTQNVTFKTLWLASESEQKAKKQIFTKTKTILFGTNGTGKSRITKNLFWTLGCTPEKHIAPKWDPDTIGALEFDFNEKSYLIVRQRKNMGLFTWGGELLAVADSHGTWDRIMADFFGYKMMLQRKANTKPARVGIDYLTLPFYIDQDGGWGATWGSYSNLNQFRKWQKSVFEAFIGLRPNGYFTEYQRWQEANDQFKVMKDNFETQKMAFSRVRQILPKNVPILNSARFENELVDLGEQSRALQKRQNVLRAKLVVAINLKEKIDAELRLAVEAHKSLTEDLGFISEFNDADIECPTCGTLHANSFHARLQLTQDAHSISLLVGELRSERTKSNRTHETILIELKGIDEDSKKINAALREGQVDIQAKDLLLAAHSVQTLDNAFDEVTSELTKEIEVSAAEVEKYRLAYKKYEDRVRQKDVNSYFNTSISYFSGKLNIPAEEQIIKAKAGDRGKGGGSSAPRSLMAVHLAMLKTNTVYGDMPNFPFVVDTPQQSGQDLDNLSSMIEILNGDISPAHQTILALEMLPASVDISQFDVVHYTEKRALLNTEDFQQVGFLKPRLLAMHDAIAEAKASGRSKAT